MKLVPFSTSSYISCPPTAKLPLSITRSIPSIWLTQLIMRKWNRLTLLMTISQLLTCIPRQSHCSMQLNVLPYPVKSPSLVITGTKDTRCKSVGAVKFLGIPRILPEFYQTGRRDLQKMAFVCFCVVSANIGCYFLSQTMLCHIFDRIFRAFAHISKDFSRSFRDFVRIFNKLKLLGVCLHPLHPLLLHYPSTNTNGAQWTDWCTFNHLHALCSQIKIFLCI